MVEAVKTKQLKFVDALIQFGSSVAVQEPGTLASPVAFAFQGSLVDVARLLLAYGADLNVTDKAGKKPRDVRHNLLATPRMNLIECVVNVEVLALMTSLLISRSCCVCSSPLQPSSRSLSRHGMTRVPWLLRMLQALGSSPLTTKVRMQLCALCTPF